MPKRRHYKTPEVVQALENGTTIKEITYLLNVPRRTVEDIKKRFFEVILRRKDVSDEDQLKLF